MLYNCYIMYEFITCFLLQSFVLLIYWTDLFILLYRVYKKSRLLKRLLTSQSGLKYEVFLLVYIAWVLTV